MVRNTAPSNLAQGREQRSDGRRVVDAHRLGASIVRGGQIVQGLFDGRHLWANTRGTTNLARTPKSGFRTRHPGLNKPIPNDLQFVPRAMSGIAQRVLTKIANGRATMEMSSRARIVCTPANAGASFVIICWAAFFSNARILHDSRAFDFSTISLARFSTGVSA